MPAARLALAVLAIVALLAAVPAGALADGDPASDVLAAQPLFLPQDGGIPSAQQARLGALVAAAARQGTPIRVALIATSSDLGSITQLWRMPIGYAEFLGQELSLVYRGTLLVLMPDGVGVYHYGGLPSADRTAVASAPAPGTGAAMGNAAIALVQRLAAASGHPLTVGNVSAPRAASSGSVLGGATGWLVLIAGAGLIAVAWTASLRARPAGVAREPEASA